MSSPMHQLVAMGFDERQSTLALQKHGDNVQRAIDWLFSDSGRAEVSVHAANIATRAPGSAAAVPHHSHHSANGRAPAPAVRRPAYPSHGAASSHHPPALSPSPLLSSPLPAGYLRGRITKFFESNKENRTGSGYGFIEPLGGDDKFAGDLYFSWRSVLSARQAWPPNAHADLVYAVEDPSEVFAAAGDIVAYRIVLQHNYIDKRSGGPPRAQPHAVDIKVLDYARNSKYRRTQAQAAAGENAPMQAMAASSSSSAAASSSYGAAAAAMPAAPVTHMETRPLRDLVGTRMRGIIHQLSGDDSGPSRPGSRGIRPHGFVAVHHQTHASVLFFLADFKETRHAAASSSGGSSAAVSSLRSRLHVGDVVEFTLESDSVLDLAAKELSIVPTLTYGQVAENARKQRDQENVGASGDLATLLAAVPLVYIQGSHVAEDESRHLEFKSLTRSASSIGMQQNLAKTADKYMNSFLNSHGGVLLFGVENDGLVVGLSVTKKERDSLRIAIDGFMSESTPAVSPAHYCFRFVRVCRLFKSSWCGAGGGAGGASLGATLTSVQTAAQMSEAMLSPDRDDRVEQLEQYVIAIVTAPGNPDVLYQTSGRGYATKESFVRRDGSTVRMTPVDIEQRTKERRGREQRDSAANIDELLRSIQQQVSQATAAAQPTAAALSPEMLATIVRQVEEKMRAEQAQITAATAAAASSAVVSSDPQAQARPAPAPVSIAPSPAAAVSSISPSSSSSPGSSLASVGASLPSAPAPAPSSNDFQVPTQLLSALQSMSFTRSSILDACYELHDAREVDFRVVFKPESADAANADATNKVLNLLLAKMASPQPSPKPREEEEGEGEPIGVQAPAQRSGNDAPPRELAPSYPAFADASSSFGAAAPSASSFPPVAQRTVSNAAHGISHVLEGPSVPHAYASSSSPSPAPLAASSPVSVAAPSSFAPPLSVASPAADEVQLPCELCGALCSFDELLAHQEQCRANRLRVAQEERRRAAAQAPEEIDYYAAQNKSPLGSSSASATAHE